MLVSGSSGERRPIALHQLERAGEPGFQELAQLGCRLELRKRVQFLECRRKGVGEVPDRARPRN